MATMQLNVDPKRVLLSKQSLSSSVNSASACYDLFTTIGIQVNVTNAVGLTATSKIQVSIDGTNWGDYLGSSVNLTANTVVPYNISEFAFIFLRVAVTVSAGSADFEIISVAKQG
jgi:hypothetical protein